MISDGKDENGKPIGKLLKPNAYFATYNEAYAALIEYNKNPYEISKDITMNELYEKWFKYYSETVSKSYVRDIESAWKYCKDLYDLPLRSVRGRHLKETIDNAYRLGKDKEIIPASPTIKLNIKKVFNQMYKYALEYDLVERNYAKEITISKTVVKELKENLKSHHTFSESEIDLLWKNIKDQAARMILIQCYTGLRPGELCEIRINTINLTDWFMIGGKKTEAGKNRMVPIHKKIRSLVQEEYSKAIASGAEYLFTRKKLMPHSYDTYYKLFNEEISVLGLDEGHKPHDPRKHFITMAKKSGVDEYAIKLIVGHAITDITESVYTERNLEWLHKEVSKIP